MFPVSDGSVIAATTPIIVRDKRISAIVKAIHTDSPRSLRAGFAGVAIQNGINFNVIPNLFRDLSNNTGSFQRWSDAETVLLDSRKTAPRKA